MRLARQLRPSCLSAHGCFSSVAGHPANACEGTPFIRPTALEGRNEPRENLDCLDVLTGDEASAVLRELLSSRPDLLPDARRAANALLATVSFTDVAKRVFDALLALDTWTTWTRVRMQVG